MGRKQLLTHWTFRGGFAAAASFLAEGLDCLVEGSRNLLLLGAIHVGGQDAPASMQLAAASMRPWKGLQSKGASTGSRKMCVVGKTWGGIKDIGGIQGAGSIIEDFGRSLWMIGAGQPSIAGADISGVTLSTSLKVAIASGGIYNAANTFVAGMSQPAAPTVAVSATAGTVNGAISIKIARFRSTTGGRSRASNTSAVISPANTKFIVTFPAASTGQDFWRVFVTKQGFGGVGVHVGMSFNGSLDISEADVVASPLGGRQMEFDFADGDLFLDEVAYIDDFAPQPATHCCRIGLSMCVLGGLADSTAAPTSTSTGTAGQISLPNFYESYKPRDLVYFPEQIVDVICREWDALDDAGGGHAFVLHKNSVSVLEYVGEREDGPAVACSTAWGDVGFQYPHNACGFFGRLAGMVGKGSLVMMDENGQPDLTWGTQIRDFIADWEPSSTVAAFHPDNLSIVIANGGTALSYSLENKKWSPPCYFRDAGITGNALAGVASGGELVLSLDNAGAHTAYAFDKGATLMEVTCVSNWAASPSPVMVEQIAMAFDTDIAFPRTIVGLHADLRKTYVRDASVTLGSNVMTSASGGFTPDMDGYAVAIYGNGVGVGGPFINQLVARVQYVSATQLNLFHLGSPSDPFPAAASAANCYATIAHDMAVLTLTRSGAQHSGPVEECMIRETFSHAVSITLTTLATRGRVMSVETWGRVMQGTLARIS